MPRRNNPAIPPKRQLPRRACASKRAFATKEQAARTAEDLRRLHDNDTAHRVYLCTECGKWHMTSAS